MIASAGWQLAHMEEAPAAYGAEKQPVKREVVAGN
jgi:hypothetical protein